MDVKGSLHILNLAEAAKVIPVPSKVDFLNGVPIKMAALGSDHSIAITGYKRTSIILPYNECMCNKDLRFLLHILYLFILIFVGMFFRNRRGFKLGRGRIRKAWPWT